MGKKTLSILIVVLYIVTVTAASASAAKSATNINNSKDTDIGKVNLKTTTATGTIGNVKGETVEKSLPPAGTTFEGTLDSWAQKNRPRIIEETKRQRNH